MSKENIYNSIQNLYNMDKTTWQEVLAELYNLVYDIDSQFEQIENKFNIHFDDTVKDQLLDMIEDGTLHEIINQNLFSDLNSKINLIKNDVTNKANKSDITALSSQINNIIVGTTANEDNLETRDIRVSLEGTTYNTARESIVNQFEELFRYLDLKKKLGTSNIINTNEYIGKVVSEIFTVDASGYNYYTPYIAINNLASFGSGVGLRCWIDFSESTATYNNINVRYYNASKEEINYFGVRNPVSSQYPITGAKFIRLQTNSTKYEEIKNYIITGFALGMNLMHHEDFKLEENGKIEKEINKAVSENYNKVMRSINRLGDSVYSPSTPPQQSIESYKSAYKKGFRILLCDLRFTSDNVPVLEHDDNINTYAKNSDGSSITNNVLISESTYNTLLQYDFGIYKGAQYAGTKIMKLDEMLKLCKNLGCECYIEVKDMNENQSKIACNLVKLYKMEDQTSWAGTFNQMQYVIQSIPSARVGTMPGIINSTRINELKQLKTGKNKVFFFSWDTTELSNDIVNQFIENDIEFEVGTINTEQGVLDYLNKGAIYNYCTGIESDSIVAGKVILDNEIG